jgi:hypothetical protein
MQALGGEKDRDQDERGEPTGGRRTVETGEQEGRITSAVERGRGDRAEHTDKSTRAGSVHW